MSAKQAVPRTVQFFARAGVLTLCFSLSAAVCGCRMQHLEDSTLALDAATAPVVDQAAAAYRDANALHNLRLDYDAVAEFDAQEPVYNPRNIQVLLSDKDIEARLAVLEAFQVYTKSLCAIVSGTNPPELGEASANLGGKLSTLANTLAPTIEKAAGVAKSDAGSTAGPAISTEAQNAISTGIDALGKFLISRKIKAELPAKSPRWIHTCRHWPLCCEAISIFSRTRHIATSTGSLTCKPLRFARTATLPTASGARRS